MDFSQFDETRGDSPDDEEQMVFHYSREERLRHAPKIVQDYYSGDFGPYKGGLFRSLVNTKANRLLFVAIVFCFGIVMFMNLFGPQKNVGSAGGVSVDLSAFSYDETVYASFCFEDAGKKRRADFADGVPVFVTFSALGADSLVIAEEKVAGKYDGNELFLRTTFTDYDIVMIRAVGVLNESYSTLESGIERR